MSRRACRCPLTAAEWAVVEEMRRLTAITTDANVLRLGLFHLARHLDLPIAHTVFAQRPSGGRRMQLRKTPRTAQVTAMVAHGPLTCEQIADRLGIGRTNAQILLRRLVQAGQLTHTKEAGLLHYAVPTPGQP